MPTTQTAVATIPSHAYRVVLFGMPDAGKSSLLGALAQAAQVQEPALGGTLIDKSQGLVELQRRLYEDRPRQTLEEIVPFPIRLEPLGTKRAGSEPDMDAVLFDCDGRIAGELLAHKDSLTGDLSKRASCSGGAGRGCVGVGHGCVGRSGSSQARLWPVRAIHPHSGTRPRTPSRDCRHACVSRTHQVRSSCQSGGFSRGVGRAHRGTQKTSWAALPRVSGPTGRA